MTYLTLSVTGMGYGVGVEIAKVFRRKEHTPFLTHDLGGRERGKEGGKRREREREREKRYYK